MTIVDPQRLGARPDAYAIDPLADLLSLFRTGFYRCLTARADCLFELADAVLCADGPVKALVDLSLTAEHRRGHGGLYDAINYGAINLSALRFLLAAQPIPRAANGQIVLAVDVSSWLRPDAATSPDRLFCHTYGRGKDKHQMIPGWPYSFVAALGPGRTSWTALLDAVHIEPADDVAEATASQLRGVVTRLIAAGQWQNNDPPILIVCDAGYDVPRLATELADLPIEVLGRLRSDRVLYQPTPRRTYNPYGGRPKKHGPQFKFTDPTTWHKPSTQTTSDTERYGKAVATSWNRMHPRLTHRSAWLTHRGKLPIIDGTVIRLEVERLPNGGQPKPVWLWSSRSTTTAAEVTRLWQAFLRRFDLEHTFRFLKQTLGWTVPRIRTPEAADRWTWLIIVAHTQLRLARGLAADLRRPWERPAQPGRLTPARVRRGFRNIRPTLATPASAPKPSHPAPDAHPDPRTASAPPATTSARPSSAKPHSAPNSSKEVKEQA